MQKENFIKKMRQKNISSYTTNSLPSASSPSTPYIRDSYSNLENSRNQYSGNNVNKTLYRSANDFDDLRDEGMDESEIIQMERIMMEEGDFVLPLSLPPSSSDNAAKASSVPLSYSNTFKAESRHASQSPMSIAHRSSVLLPLHNKESYIVPLRYAPSDIRSYTNLNNKGKNSSSSPHLKMSSPHRRQNDNALHSTSLKINKPSSTTVANAISLTTLSSSDASSTGGKKRKNKSSSIVSPPKKLKMENEKKHVVRLNHVVPDDCKATNIANTEETVQAFLLDLKSSKAASWSFYWPSTQEKKKLVKSDTPIMVLLVVATKRYFLPLCPCTCSDTVDELPRLSDDAQYLHTMDLVRFELLFFPHLFTFFKFLGMHFVL
jgi:hypothetical protein